GRGEGRRRGRELRHARARGAGSPSLSPRRRALDASRPRLRVARARPRRPSTESARRSSRRFRSSPRRPGAASRSWSLPSRSVSQTTAVSTIETQYARSGDVNIAYQVVGDGPIDLVWVMGWVSNIDFFWQEPSFARFLRRLASFSRLILFDKRGTGMSDRVPIDALPTLEQRM